MNYVDHLNNFEIFKMANELAVEIYPFCPAEKDEREKLIDFKDVLRKALKSKSKIISHDKADILLKYMNPKRKWPWERLETFNYIYEIEPNFEVFSNLLDVCGVVVDNSNEELIYKYLIISELYDKSILSFLFEIYDLKLPKLSSPFEDNIEILYTEKDIKAAKKILKSGNFKPCKSPILLNTNLRILEDDIEDEIDDILVEDIDIDDIEIDIDELDKIDINDFDEDDFEDGFKSSKIDINK